MKGELSGRSAVVTGGSRGIGQAIATGLADLGCRIAVVSSKEENGATTVARIEEMGGVARPYGVDVASFSAVEQTCKQILADFGSIDILVNNAGVTRDGLLLRMSEEDFDQVIAVNLKGAFSFTRCLLRSLMKSDHSRIISISSIVGITGNAGQTNYAASKAGIIGFTRSLAKEVGSRGVTVNAIAPGYVETDMTAALGEEKSRQLLEQVPLQRMGTTADIAAIACFLCGPGGAYITGQTIVVDGGLSL